MNTHKVVAHVSKRNCVQWLSTFFRKTFVSLVNRRIDILMVKFCRSMSESIHVQLNRSTSVSSQVGKADPVPAQV